jgi:hypothetical protein
VPITSRDELVSLLRQVPGLHEFNRDIMIDTAFFMRDGSLSSLYMRLMIETCPFGQIDEFFRSARAFMRPNYGNPDDEEVFYPYRATGLDPPANPCEPQEWWSCWVKKGRTWQPRNQSPTPR